jgi:hypothetical protein
MWNLVHRFLDGVVIDSQLPPCYKRKTNKLENGIPTGKMLQKRQERLARSTPEHGIKQKSNCSSSHYGVDVALMLKCNIRCSTY